MTDETIICEYTCNKCGIKRRKVSVPLRKPEQRVDVWVQQVCAPMLSNDHRAESPECRITSFSEVYIPTTGRDQIGGPVVQ